MVRKSKEEWKIYKNVFDAFTLRLLFKLSSQGHFEELKSPIALGKEANIFSASTKGGNYVIIKIYRLENCDFNQMYNYIKQDPRYINMKKTHRQIVFAWTQREYRNLLKARASGTKVPTPLTFARNILIMEFIGSSKIAAPKLKDFAPKDKKRFFDDTLDNMRMMLKAGLVHGDLSSFNILNNNDKPVLIDLSQATPVDAPNANELLDRDIRNVCTYFTKIGIKTSESEIKRSILNSED